MPLVDVEYLRGVYEVHNSAGPDFPEILARDYLHSDVDFVEFADAPGAAVHHGSEAVAALFRDRFEAGAMRVDELQLTALDEHRALAAFTIRMRGSGSGAETSMRLWNLVTVDGLRIARIEEFSDEATALRAAGR